ncbi:MAG: GPW/gp25 family protein [Hyphomicrobiaceae bacterium]|nr:GPW/gp25 family protein [Hyphomicrobiaceae bacterium]
MASIGINRHTGSILRGWEHGRQSIDDILSTSKLTRVMQRLYGSDVPKLVDATMTDRVLLAFYVAIATAISLWEPRYELTQVNFLELSPNGKVRLALVGNWYENGHKGDFSQPVEQGWEVVL